MMDGFYTLLYHEIVEKEGYDRSKYHGIKVNQDYADTLPEPLFVFKDEFDKQMKYLYEAGYKTLTLKEVQNYYYQNQPLPEKSILITFDDCYKSVLLNAYPTLRKYGFNAVAFVVLAWLFDEPIDYDVNNSITMSKEELLSMRDVFEYANHTNALHTREGMKSGIQCASREAFLKDLHQCEAFVNSKGSFAYPFGYYDKETIETLKEFGTKIAFTTLKGINTKDRNPYELYRNMVTLGMSLREFTKMIENY